MVVWINSHNEHLLQIVFTFWSDQISEFLLIKCQNFFIPKFFLVNVLLLHYADQIKLSQHHPSVRRKLKNSRLLICITCQPGDQIFVLIRIVYTDGIISNVWDNKNFFGSRQAWTIELQDQSIMLRTVANQIYWHAAVFKALSRSWKIVVVVLYR